jgi:hypothetical protein
MDKKLGVIVPYRDRDLQLEAFKKFMPMYLRNQKIRYEIIIVNQDNGKMFNRGMLLNIGFKYAVKLRCDYVVFHDIDLIPVEVDYSYSEHPIHLAKKTIDTETNEIKESFDKYFGGVTLFSVDDFIKINGYSNKYWGWGFEDDDLFLRCEYARLKSDRILVENSISEFQGLYFNGKDSFVKFKNTLDIEDDLTIFTSFYPVDLIYNHTKETDVYTVFSIPGYDTAISYNSFQRYNFCTFDSDDNVYSVSSEIKTEYLTTMCVVFDSKMRKVRVYQDGKFIGESGGYEELRDYQRQRFLYLGAGNPKREGDPNFFKGYIDCFAAIERKLSDEEVLEISSSRDFSRFKDAGDLKVHYSSNNIKNYELEDLSGNNNHGKITRCEIMNKKIGELKEVKIPARREGKFKSLKHEENGYKDGKWKNQHTRWNQLRFHNEVSRNKELISSEGLSNLVYAEHGRFKVDNITHVNVGI